MQAFVISDIHLGSRFCMADRLLRFLDDLPPDATLVLNGDTLDRWHPHLPPEHVALVDRFRQEARQRPVLWLHGNHDRKCPLDDPGSIVFLSSWHAGNRLYVAHGHDFDNVTIHKPFIHLFRLLYRLRDRFGGESIHVASYAKRFQFLYGLLRKHVMSNAVAYASKHGFKAVACGHTHYPEDSVVQGIRYINTGSWTEKPVFCLHVDDKAIHLEQRV